MNIPTKRRDAIASGASHYFTGKPCKHGHIAKRLTSNGVCVECAAEINTSEARNESRREHYRKNIERERETAREKAKRYAEKANEARRRRIAADPEAYRAKRREQYQRKREAKAATYREWQRNNRGIVNNHQAARKALLHMATPAWANPFFMQGAYEIADARSRVTGIKWVVDHIVPLKSPMRQSLNGPDTFQKCKFIGPLLPIVQGLHCEANLRVITEQQNLRKGNRTWPDMP